MPSSVLMMKKNPMPPASDRSCMYTPSKLSRGAGRRLPSTPVTVPSFPSRARRTPRRLSSGNTSATAAHAQKSCLNSVTGEAPSPNSTAVAAAVAAVLVEFPDAPPETPAADRSSPRLLSNTMPWMATEMVSEEGRSQSPSAKPRKATAPTVPNSITGSSTPMILPNDHEDTCSCTLAFSSSESSREGRLALLLPLRAWPGLASASGGAPASAAVGRRNLRLLAALELPGPPFDPGVSLCCPPAPPATTTSEDRRPRWPGPRLGRVSVGGPDAAGGWLSTSSRVIDGTGGPPCGPSSCSSSRLATTGFPRSVAPTSSAACRHRMPPSHCARDRTVTPVRSAPWPASLPSRADMPVLSLGSCFAGARCATARAAGAPAAVAAASAESLALPLSPAPAADAASAPAPAMPAPSSVPSGSGAYPAASRRSRLRLAALWYVSCWFLSRRSASSGLRMSSSARGGTSSGGSAPSSARRNAAGSGFAGSSPPLSDTAASSGPLGGGGVRGRERMATSRSRSASKAAFCALESDSARMRSEAASASSASLRRRRSSSSFALRSRRASASSSCLRRSSSSRCSRSALRRATSARLASSSASRLACCSRLSSSSASSLA
mmetsp:Transcript_13553/g.51740  ORF Transcript_13553/g.51740 Transcript_13553/m.51740 type:complete len:610 (-) Transcript_13553:312-2141(-)